MAELTKTQSAKQGTRNLMHKASDKVKVMSAKVSGGDFKDFDIAIVKATTVNFHVVPKEKHVRTLKTAVHSSQPRKNVTYVITELHKRLQSSTDWLTALKTLVTIHRLMRETDSSFMEELVKLAAHLTHGKGRLLNMDNFIDRTNIEGRFDFSEWVRAYGKYLDEQLEAYSAITWYVEQEQAGGQSRLRSLPSRDLLYQLPFLQRLQRRLLDCVPKGQAARDPVVLFALGLVVKESFTLYKAVSEGIINLADTFFEMDYLDAVKALEQYKESIASNDALANYYATIEQIDEVKRAMQLPKLASPPSDFVKSMEAYVADAPRPAAEGEAAHKKAAPLRKGKLLAPGKRAAAAPPTQTDPGMVLPVGIAPSSPSSPVQTASPPSAKTPAGAGAGMDLLGFDDLSLQEQKAAAPPPTATAAPASKPSPLDLLSGLDFSYPAEPSPAAATNPTPAYAAPGYGAPPPPPSSSNPFGSSNPFAAPQPPAPAPGMQQWGSVPAPQPAYGGAYQTYSMGGAPGYAAGQYMSSGQQPGLPSPGAAVGGSSGAMAPDWGGAVSMPSPSAYAASPASAVSPGLAAADSLRSSSGNPLRASGNGLLGTPVRSPSNNVDLFKQAGAHDPFAQLVASPGSGLPSPSKPSPARPSLSPTMPASSTLL